MSSIFDFADGLLDHVGKCLVKPLSIYNHLQSRGLCTPDCKCIKMRTLVDLDNPWSKENQKKIFQWMHGWYCHRYEEPFNAALLLPAIADFLSQRYTAEQITQGFRMEFSAKGRRAVHIPKCFYRDPRSVKINKTYKGHGGMCCDFALVDPLEEHLVGEVKLLTTNININFLQKFLDDLDKCSEWLKPSTHKYLPAKFKIKEFSAAMCILVDLTDGKESSRWWKSKINETDLRSKGIIVRHIVIG